MTTVADFTTFVFSVNRDDIIRLAMTDCGALGVGEDIAPEDLAYCSDKLNMLVKQWQGTSDFAPGLKMWSRKRADLFLQIDKVAYQLGPSDEKWVPDGGLTTTALTVAAAASASTITVADASSINAGTKIGILLSSGASHWTAATAEPTGLLVPLLSAMPSTAAVGAAVYLYESNAVRPLQILSAVLRNNNNQETPLSPMTLEEYEALPAKADPNTTGTAHRYYYESQITSGVLYLDVYPANVAIDQRLHIVYLSPIEDLIVSTDTPDYPQNWYRALAAQLAMDIAPGFQLPASKELMALRNDAVSIARNQDPDTSRAYFQAYLEDF